MASLIWGRSPMLYHKFLALFFRWDIQLGVRFCLEVYPIEIAFDIVTAKRALEAVEHHPSFGFNYDPSHLGYQGDDFVMYLRILSRLVCTNQGCL